MKKINYKASHCNLDILGLNNFIIDIIVFGFIYIKTWFIPKLIVNEIITII